MRLIDADEFEDVAVEYQKRHVDDFPLTRGEYKLIDEFLFEYPTADAIPIGWIEAQIDAYKAAGQGFHARLFEKAIEAWRAFCRLERIQ